jgi:hypothetical protein
MNRLILSLGVPRSGTIVVFNMLREILTWRGIPFRSVNTNYPETVDFLSRYDFSDTVLMHAHNVLPPVQELLPREDVVACFNFRDPRDVVVSMMRLHDYSFEKCLELVDISFQQFTAARAFPRVMFIPYQHLVSAPEVFVFQIARHLGEFLPLDEVRRIAHATSLESHRRIMEAVANDQVEVRTRRNPRRTLRESATHFINDRHIQSGRSGRWREELTEVQQETATGHFSALLRDLGLQ